MDIPQDTLKEFQKKLSDFYLYEIFANQFELADRIRRLKTLQEDPIEVKKMEDINTRLKAAQEAKLEAQNKQSTAKKYADKKAANDAFELAEGMVEKIRMEKSRSIKPMNDLYIEISAYAEKVQVTQKSYEFTKTFDGTVKDELPYAELDGTRYVMKGNILEKNAYGQMVLLVEPKKDEPENSTDKL